MSGRMNPLTMTQDAEDYDRTTIKLRLERFPDTGIVLASMAARGWAEVDAIRIAYQKAELSWRMQIARANAHAKAMRDALEKADAAFNAWARDEDGIHPDAWTAVEHLRATLAAQPSVSLADPPVEVIEQLAALEHDQWMQWAQSLMDSEPGLSTARRERWRSLMVPYAELPEEMKEHDRKWARLVIAARAQEVKP